MRIEILPSLLAADFGRLGDEIRRAEASGAEALHLDIMDAHFVPNLSFGPDVVALARRTAPDFYRNVHLMMSRPDLYLEKFAAAGAQTIQIHVEADCDLHHELARIRQLGLKNAIVLNPETPVERLEPYLNEVDEILVMTVHPGYGGQKFIAECLTKVAFLRERRPSLDIMVDGGVNGETAVEAARAGANQFVAGSYLFKQADMKAAVDAMRQACAKAGKTMKTIVVIPTYDEKDNVRPMAEAVLKAAEGVEVLFVDDNSPDGTGAIVDGMVAADARVHILHRTKKEGLGRAYVAGFQEALRLGADLVIQMDCDFSHDPKDIPRLIAAASADPQPGLVIGSRYVKGGATPGWPFKRRLISRLGGIFIRTVTGMPLNDPTGGFKCWRRATLEALDLPSVQSAGYSFQLEMNHRTWKRGFRIVEIPIVFTDRVAGYSKITAGIAVESIRIALRLRFRSQGR